MQGSALHERLEALLQAPLRGKGAVTIEHIEHTLTDGYAHALALDAERSRLARKIGALAAREGGDTEKRAREMSLLSQRLAETDAELADLRRALTRVRRRATELRTLTAA